MKITKEKDVKSNDNLSVDDILAGVSLTKAMKTSYSHEKMVKSFNDFVTNPLKSIPAAFRTREDAVLFLEKFIKSINDGIGGIVDPETIIKTLNAITMDKVESEVAEKASKLRTVRGVPVKYTEAQEELLSAALAAYKLGLVRAVANSELHKNIVKQYLPKQNVVATIINDSQNTEETTVNVNQETEEAVTE